jgi:uncharacterized protein (TIGR03032 family)
LLRRPDIGRHSSLGRPLLPTRSQFFPGSLYTHDLALIGGVLHANAVGHNAVVRISAAGTYQHVWWPRCIERGGEPLLAPNHIQLNSIAAGKSLRDSYFSASSDHVSRRRPGHSNYPVNRRGVIFSGRTREVIVRGLTRPHSARLHHGRIWVDNSGYGEVGYCEGGKLEVVARLPGWTRGLAFFGDYAFVGTSRVIPRFRQYAPGLVVDKCICAVHVLDLRSGRVMGSMVWSSGNQLFAIDWASRAVTDGFLFTPGRRSNERERDVFYAFRLADLEA